MKVGDLVCYNSCGMKHKTLGLVLEMKGRYSAGTDLMVLIQWCAIGKYMPRRAYMFGFGFELGKEIHSGDLAWHDIGDWFEVVNEKF